jgi:hypothetical protein
MIATELGLYPLIGFGNDALEPCELIHWLIQVKSASRYI